VQSVPLLVGRDAVVVFTARGSRVPACLSTSELRLLTGASSARRATWQGIGPASLPLVVVVPEPGSGTRDAYVSRVLVDPATGDPIDLRGDAVPATQGPQMLARVLGARGAIGITGFATIEPSLGKVRLVEVNDGDGCVAPSPATIASGDYPLTRDLLMVIRSNATGDNADVVSAFGDTVASPRLLGRPGSGLSPADIEATGRAWRDRSTQAAP
jgi:phosphate transport system substrate-binding protein